MKELLARLRPFLGHHGLTMKISRSLDRLEETGRLGHAHELLGSVRIGDYKVNVIETDSGLGIDIRREK